VSDVVDTVEVVLAVGPDLERAVTDAVIGFGLANVAGDAEERIVIVCAGRSDLEQRAAQRVAALATETSGQAAPIVVAPSGLFSGAPRRSVRGGAFWVTVEVGARGERIGRVPVRRDVAGAGSLVAVAALRLDRAERPPLALGLWPGFVHPRLALAARLGGDRVPFVAEIALAFAPRLLLLVGQTATRSFAVATSDRIAADLVGLALRAEYVAPDADRVGPWEDPLVQRATELGLGVRLPRQINLQTLGTGRADDDGSAELPALGSRLRLTLGMPDAPLTSPSNES
jgi:hypothetical protein